MVVYPDGRKLFINEKYWVTDPCNNISEHQQHCAIWLKKRVDTAYFHLDPILEKTILL